MNCKKTIRDLDVAGKRALVRVDFDVPVTEQGEITDDRRIRAALPTIRNLVNRGAAVILMTHLGHPRGEASQDQHLKLDHIAKRLEALMVGTKVVKCDDIVGSRVEQLAEGLQSRQILLLENLRFHGGEKNAEVDFANRLRHLGDFYVNDAFATSHRKHASIYVVPQLFPHDKRVVGLLVESELRAIDRVFDSPRKPFIAVLGGADLSEKLALVQQLQQRVDRLLVGGAMAYTFLKAKGISVGASIVQPSQLQFARRLLDHAPNRFILPTDHIVTDRLQLPANVAITEGGIDAGWYGMDIGPFTIDSFCKTIACAGTVVWNGPMGKFEEDPYRKGTEAIAQTIARSSAISLIAGGETAAAVENLCLSDRMTHVSIADGALLHHLGEGMLPALSVIDGQNYMEQKVRD